jgi:hypothetical protein
MARATAAPPARAWTIEERARNIHKIRIDLPRVGDECWILLQSDVHWDHPTCDRSTLKRHLDQAKERDALILDAGDFFCAMQSRFDKRSGKSDIRAEHLSSRYTDALVDTAAEYLKPYANNLGVRGMGNHETAILKKLETNITERLVEQLRVKGSPTIHRGGYSGYVVFEVDVNGRRQAIKLHYHHGSGGGGAVTRGVIQTNRQAVYLADADIVWNGHTHDHWIVVIERVRLSHDVKTVERVRQVHVRTAGYKDEYADGHGGYHIETWKPPKPVGAAWLRIWYDRSCQTARGGKDTIVEWEVTEAR